MLFGIKRLSKYLTADGAWSGDWRKAILYESYEDALEDSPEGGENIFELSLAQRGWFRGVLAKTPPLEAIREFSDHPSLKGLNRSAIYYLDRQFYLADPLFLSAIQPEYLDYTNMGDPYRVLARLYFLNDGWADSIDIDMDTAVRLAIFCEKASIPLDITNSLQSESGFISRWDMSTEGG
jgi:hypothetical protein